MFSLTLQFHRIAPYLYIGTCVLGIVRIETGFGVGELGKH